LVGKQDLTGEACIREQDRGNPLAGSNTLNRLELGTPEAAPEDRYKKIAADPDALDSLLVDVFLDTYHKPPREIWLDLNATDDPLYGHQEGHFFHGYYRCYCHLPLHIFAQAQSTTMHVKLLKIGARIRITARKVWLSFSEAYPYANDIAQILANLQHHPAWSPSG